MKRILITLILMLTSATNAQALTDWQVGVNFNPFFFKRINPNFSYERGKQDFPNGFSYGLTIEKNWNDFWGLKTGFESAKQNEKYFFNVLNINTITKSNFEYYKIPITVQYYYPIKEKIFLTFNQGIQFSILKYFKTVIKDDYQKITYSSNYGESIFFQHPENNRQEYGDFQNSFHNKNLFGIIGSVGLKGFLAEKITYSTNLRYEYDFTVADNIPYYYNSENGKKSITHNFRLGLELGVQYHFSINDRFDKSPHKL